MTQPSGEVQFDRIYRDELSEVVSRRLQLTTEYQTQLESLSQQANDSNCKLKDVQHAALQADLCGLAISGGGIRSATFALGVLQGLAATRMLPRFDYLSTVSGGGYIGSWLMSWIRAQGMTRVEDGLQPPRLRAHTFQTPDPPEVRHIRRYSNYLAPRPGLFTVDGWTLIAIFARNMLLNQAVLFLVALGLLLMLRGVIEVFSIAHSVEKNSFAPYGITIVVALTLLAVLYCNRRFVTHGPGAGPSRPWSLGCVPWICVSILGSILFATLAAADWYAGELASQSFIETIAISAAYLAVWGTLCLPLGKVYTGSKRPRWMYFALRAVYGGMGGVLFGLLTFAWWSNILPATQAGKEFKPSSAAAVTVDSVDDGKLTSTSMKQTEPPPKTWRGFNSLSTTVATVATFGPAVMMLLIVLANFLMLGVSGALLTEIDREKWSRLNAYLMVSAAVWIALTGGMIYGPWLVGILWLNSSGGAQWVTGLAGAGWFGTLLAGLRAGQAAETGASKKSSPMALLAALAPFLFLVTAWIGLCTLTTWLAYDVYARWFVKPFDPHYLFWNRLELLLNDLDYWKISWEKGIPGLMVVYLFCSGFLFLFASWLLGRVIGVNTFTLQHLYQNRLVRCYLGASRGTQRTPDPLTNFDLDDDYPLSKLYPERNALNECGPYYIVNGALNQKASTRHGRHQEQTSLAEQEAEKLQFVERQAESFIFTSRYCGSESTGYCPSTEFASDVSLGTAVAVSGAAVSPNSGYHSSPAVTALLTLFNIRLGAWFGHPGREQTRGHANPAAQSLLLAEMAGKTGSDSDYVYVSDGGHFENMGVYELIRRRCRFILAIDSGADPEFHENVGRLVRLVRIDFGIYVELDPETITPGPDGLCKSHIIVGRIHYGDVHQYEDNYQPQPVGDPSFSAEANHGIILWIKNGLTGDEPGDVRNYKLMNPAFPYETTLDQFFSESQFESYRALGIHSLLHSVRIPSPVARESSTHNHPPVTLMADLYPSPQPMQMETSRSALEWVTRESQLASNRSGTARDSSPTEQPVLAAVESPGFSTRQLFETTYSYWLQKPDRFISVYLNQNDGYIRIMQQLREEPRLKRLSAELYGTPEQRRVAEKLVSVPEDQLAERLMANEMFTLLSNVWFGLNFEQTADHPAHHGWRGVFKDWCASPTLKAAWKDSNHPSETPSTGLQHEYNPAFRRFLERFIAT